MAGERIRLDVKTRDARGSAEARRLRAKGLVPGVLYGQGEKAHSFCVNERALRHVLTGEHGLHAILDVVIEGAEKPHHAILKDYQLDPTRARLLHVDLHEVRLDRPIQSQVVVELVGTPEGVVQGGVLSQVTREVTVEALPMEMPDRLSIDVGGLAIGDSVRVADLAAGDGMRILDDPDEILATVTPPTLVELPEDVLPEEAAAEDLPPEQQPEGGAATPGGDAAGEPGTVEG